MEGFRYLKEIGNSMKLKVNLDYFLSNIPNLPLSDVPIGENEKSNKIIKKSSPSILVVDCLRLMF